MNTEWLNITWYVLVGVLFTGYAILDGFDLGTGVLHLFTKKDEHRRILLNAIGPVWDGNEVWLVTGGGALFAAFPEVYATAFSGFYLAFMFLLFMLIFRAVSIDVRSKQESVAWRKFWDTAFAVSSTVAALLIGVALGNIAWGVPVDADFEYKASLWSQLHPYALLVGLTTVALFAMHAAIYNIMKTEGELNEQIRGWVRPTMIAFFVMYGITTLATLLFVPRMTEPFRVMPFLFIVPLLNVLAIANIPREIHHGREFRAFLSSSVSIVLLLILFAIGMFPEFIHGLPDGINSLTAFNAASSPKTLKVMLIIAIIGMPMVLAYTISIYWIFRGKVKLDKMSY